MSLSSISNHPAPITLLFAHIRETGYGHDLLARHDQLVSKFSVHKKELFSTLYKLARVIFEINFLLVLSISGTIEMDPSLDGIPRTYVIKRYEHLGYGFVAGNELPTMVKLVEPNGPSFKKLLPHDIIMAINGINVESAPREQIIKMIQLCDQIEITVRQPTYEQLIRAKNLADPKFYTLNRTSNPGISNKSSNNRNGNCTNSNSSIADNPTSLNHLVTPIAQQNINNNYRNPARELPPKSPISPGFTNGHNALSSQVPASVLRQQLSTNGDNVGQGCNYQTRTLGRNYKLNYGRHSPLSERCKSSIDHQNGKTNKNSSDASNYQPSLKRSNTMRPIKISPKLMEIMEKTFKVFIEDCHYRSFEHKPDTTVGKVLETLNTRLDNSPYAEQVKKYFGLALTVEIQKEGSPREAKPKIKLHILDENDSIRKIKQLPYAHRLRILYRMVYPPPDVEKLYYQHKVAFEYLYRQSCNDLCLERFHPELDNDTALKLSALHLIEYVNSKHAKGLEDSKKNLKSYIKLIEEDKEIGLKYFVPTSMIESTTDKKGKRVASQYKKLRNKLIENIRENFEQFDFEPPVVKRQGDISNRCASTSFHATLPSPETQMSISDHIKLIFLKDLSQLPCYGNSRKPVRSSTSPIERSSVGDCSSSLESVPRTSDSSPLIKQESRFQMDSVNENNSLKTDTTNGHNSISRLAQMNSMRSLNSVPSSITSQHIDQPDMAQTPSIESISSITFNMQSSPSPQQALLPQQVNSDCSLLGENYHTIEPSPMPRQQTLTAKLQDQYSLEKLYNQRYKIDEKPLEELLKNVILLKPPPPLSNNFAYSQESKMIDYEQRSCLTQILTDRDIENLRCPPPPGILN